MVKAPHKVMEVAPSYKTCETIESPYIMPGWGCCVCFKQNGGATYSDQSRDYCKICAHVRCDK